MKKITLAAAGVFGVVVLVLLMSAVSSFIREGEIAKELPAATVEIKPVKVYGLSEAQAILKVQALPEVAGYETMLENAGKKASFEAQDDEGAWSVQVFEIVKNGDEPSHTATFGWYRVDKKTGVAEKEL